MAVECFLWCFLRLSGDFDAETLAMSVTAMRLPQFLAVHQANYSHAKRTAVVVECRAGFVRAKQKRELALAIVYLVEVPRSTLAAGRVRYD